MLSLKRCALSLVQNPARCNARGGAMGMRSAAWVPTGFSEASPPGLDQLVSWAATVCPPNALQLSPL